jgi:hypothetical protein
MSKRGLTRPWGAWVSPRLTYVESDDAVQYQQNPEDYSQHGRAGLEEGEPEHQNPQQQ